MLKYDDWRTKAAREARDEARAAGKVPILHAAFLDAQRVAGAVFTHDLAPVLFEEGVAEQSIYAHDPETGVRLRCRPDWLRPGVMVDVKTTSDAGAFDRSIEKYSYFQQAAFYIDVAALAGITVDRFFFLAVETSAPYLIDLSLMAADSSYIAIGRHLNRAAIDLYARCRKARTWPGLPEAIRFPAPPPWLVDRTEAIVERAERTVVTR
ncbi:PD-(D/E)XK nuclease-like domain-containing protein [Williamsia deligens]|nr:PD-(D/E)XK nuclease-like domain-containing protein [Williamsia deligens]